MRLSLPKLIALLSVAGISGYLLSGAIRRRTRTADVYDDTAAEIIARYRPAIERALHADEPTIA